MYNIIIVGDLQLKESTLYKKAVLSFLEWLYENYNDNIIIQLGDFFNAASINHNTVDDAFSIVKKFNQFHILTGNHDKNRRMDNILKSWNHFDNIFVYEKETEINLNDFNCLMLPHQFNMDHYSELTGDYDFIFPHTSPKEESFGKKFVDLSKLNGKKIYGHIHIKNYYPESNSYIIGVPVISRFGEKNNPIVEILPGGKMKEIVPPVFFDILDLEYGQEITNKNFLYNIKNAPSHKSVYETYPAVNIRDAGITVLYKAEEKECVLLNELGKDLKDLYMTFCKEKEIDDIFLIEGCNDISEYGMV